MSFGRTNASGAAIGAWRFGFSAALPEAVAHNTFLAVTDTAAEVVTLSDAAPPNPSANTLWFQIADPTDGLALSSTAVPFRVLGAYQWDATAAVWVLRDAYYTYLGTWRKLSGLPPVGTALSACSWEQIHRIGAAGKAADYFCVGDEKTITLSTAESVTLQIIGFSHDDLSAAGGGKAPITFGFKNCLNTIQQMNATDTNVGGYSGCALYATLNNAIYGSLPADLRAVMKNVNKLTSAGNQSTSIVTTQEKLFMLSEVEIFGSTTYAKPGEGTQYAFFTNGGARVKTVNGVAATWWERSPIGSQGTYFCRVYPSGVVSNGGASEPAGIAPALCV